MPTGDRFADRQELIIGKHYKKQFNGDNGTYLRFNNDVFKTL